MATENDTAKAKKTPSPRSKSASHKSVHRKQAQTKAQVPGHKVLKMIRFLIGILIVGVGSLAVALVGQTWLRLKAKPVFTVGFFLYIVFSLVLIAALVWCIRLFNQKRVLSIWVFVGFLVISILHYMAFNWFDGRVPFTQDVLCSSASLAFLLVWLYLLKREAY